MDHGRESYGAVGEEIWTGHRATGGRCGMCRRSSVLCIAAAITGDPCFEALVHINGRVCWSAAVRLTGGPTARGVGCATGRIRQTARAEEGFRFVGFSPQRVPVCERTAKAQLIGEPTTLC